MVLISLGIDKIDPEKFEKIQNRKWGHPNKPIGGLWTSPINTSYGWVDFVKGECFREDYYLDKMILISLKENSKILKLDSEADFNLFCPIIPKSPITDSDCWDEIDKIDFEKLARDYDALWVTLKCLKETESDNLIGNLFGWDVETVLLFNLECIESYA